MKTLGSGDVIAAVKLPAGEDYNEWLAANTVDFFNEISLIWDIIVEARFVDDGPGKGFPPGFEYRWADNKSRSPISCSGPQYVQYVIEWIDSEINNESIFPTSPSVPFPSNFSSSVKVIFTRIFRVFAIIYTNHYSKIDQQGAASHLNTSFKHFLFFTWEFQLVKDAEMEALHDIVEEIKSRYGGGGGSESNSGNSNSADDGSGAGRSRMLSGSIESGSVTSKALDRLSRK
jgi:MOB kinase activator 1